MNSAQTFFFAGFTSLGDFLLSSFNFWNILHTIWAERLSCTCILRNAFASRILGGVWMLASACVFCTKIFIPQFSLYIIVHHLKMWAGNARGQLERSVMSFEVTFVLLYNCDFFLLCSLSFTFLWLWSTCSFWLSHKNAFVSLQALRFL